MKPSSYILFARKLKGANWNPIKIHREFRKQVAKDDYAESEVPGLLEHLTYLSKAYK